MTSSNVSNLLVQVSKIDVSTNIPKQEVNSVGMFEKTLKNVADASAKSDVKPASYNSEETAEPKTTKLERPGTKKEIKPNEQPVAEDSQIVEKVEEIATDIEETIAETLDVSLEDIEDAMEDLGLLMVDLLNPQSLAELVANITGETESVALVMSEDFGTILDTVNELTNQLFAETNNSFVEIKELFIQMVEVVPEEIEVSNISEFVIDEQQEDAPSVQPEISLETENQVETQIQIQNVSVKEEQQPVGVETPEEPAEETTITPTIIQQPKDENEKSENFDFNGQKNETQTESKDTERLADEPAIRNGQAIVQPKFEPQFSQEIETVELPTGESVKASDIVNQFVEQARVLTSAEATTMEITLNPEGLGKIFLKVTQEGNEITAKIFTENDAVKQALESQMANLRTEMNQNGTKVTSIEVSVGAHEFERNLDENTRQDSQREEQAREQGTRRRGRIDVNSLDDLSGLMTDEEMLIAQMMKDNGGTLDFMA